MNDLHAVVTEMYDSICFEPGERPDWKRHAEIFAPQARMVRITDKGIFEFDNHSYIADLQAQIDSGALRGFWEKELWRETHQFGEMAQVLSGYESRTSRSGDFLGRGVNSIQLFRADGRWWISAMLWRRDGAEVRIGNAPPQPV